jgi:hypothetical protein
MRKPWKCKCGEWNWAKTIYCEKCSEPKNTEIIDSVPDDILSKLKETA